MTFFPNLGSWSVGAGNSNLVRGLSVLERRTEGLLGMSVRTGGAGRTEAGQPVDTEDSPHVTVATVGAVTAEASVVPGTVPDLCLGVNVEEGTLLVVAGVKS